VADRTGRPLTFTSSFIESSRKSFRDFQLARSKDILEKHNVHYRVHKKSRDSAVGRATGYGLDGRVIGVRVMVGARMFSSPRRPH
jgi:hypothetical protein